MIDKASIEELPKFTFGFLIQTKTKAAFFKTKEEAIKKINYYFAVDQFPSLLPLKTAVDNLPSLEIARKYGLTIASTVFLVDRFTEDFYCLRLLSLERVEEDFFFASVALGKLHSDGTTRFYKSQKKALQKTHEGLCFRYEDLTFYLKDFQKRLLKIASSEEAKNN